MGTTVRRRNIRSVLYPYRPLSTSGKYALVPFSWGVLASEGIVRAWMGRTFCPAVWSNGRLVTRDGEQVPTLDDELIKELPQAHVVSREQVKEMIEQSSQPDKFSIRASQRSSVAG